MDNIDKYFGVKFISPGSDTESNKEEIAAQKQITQEEK
jgi:hypothetical protein